MKSIDCVVKTTKKASENEQSNTADQPMAPWERATEHWLSQDIRETGKANQSMKMNTKLDGLKVLNNKTRANNTVPPYTMGATINTKLTTTQPPP